MELENIKITYGWTPTVSPYFGFVPICKDKNNILIITRRGHLAVLFSTKNNGDSVLDTHYQSKTAAESSDRQKNLLLALQLIYRRGSLGSRSLVLDAY